MKFPFFIPFLVGVALAAVLGHFDWMGFWFIFPPIGLAMTIGIFITRQKTLKDADLGRKISLTLIAPVLIVFLGFMQRENLQLEETVFYSAYFLTTMIFSRVLVHYAIAKVGGPLIFGRAYCGWACYTAALMEWLPIKENRKIDKKYTFIRFIVLIVSLSVPLIFILSGYDYIANHIYRPSYGYDDLPVQHHKYDQFIWFLVGNAVYYAAAVVLAFVFKKKRAFCRIACPVSLVMKIPSRFSLLKVRPQTENACIECGKCSEVCPMDINVMEYIRNKRPVASTECILCGSCIRACPAGAIAGAKRNN